MHNEYVSTSLGDRIKHEREVEGLTIEQCVSSSGIEQSMWLGIENGKRSISVMGLWSIAKALNCKPEDLLK
jgi:transcriptional regulator with XRE-family HTH domain